MVSPRARQNYDGVVLAVPVTVPYQRYSIETAHWWMGRALRALADGAGISHRDFDGFSTASFTMGPDTAIALTQHFGISPRWIDHIALGGAAGIVAIRRAARAVQAGDAEIVACVAADTNQVDTFRKTVANFSRFAQDASYPYGAGGPNASFALIARHYMDRYGATREDFGKLCVAQRENALKSSHALMKKPLTLEQYMSARAIAEPFHLFDCVMPCAGAEGFLVMREDSARGLGLPFVRLLSAIERHNAFPDDPVQERGGWLMDRDELYGMAGARPEQMDFVQTYDDYAIISMMQFEGLGFCGIGDGPQFVRQHTFTTDGSFPHNTSGGQLSAGQAGAAGGHLGITEAMRQLMGIAGGTQVKDAKLGLVSGFGMINYDRGLASAAAILARA
ncbi:thiolase family protein [Rhizobium oryzicola]|uniref:Thiolase family protein n=1 Tax=Rhizobium oryzicola TaxID=1232668 RepID=A0ABT8SXW4_9HYPH|nr:thiolase family protein [Rhizobium oryzicola]MDO1582728.1 thiolase family protein [Rhizobium oryzicola]